MTESPEKAQACRHGSVNSPANRGAGPGAPPRDPDAHPDELGRLKDFGGDVAGQVTR